MHSKKKLTDLVNEVQYGNEESISEIVDRLTPIINKCSRKLGYDDATPDLIEHLIKATNRYKSKK